MHPTIIYSTYPNAELAEKIAHLLVSSQLVACANILPAITSIYRWQGKMARESEVAMLCKTTPSQAEAAMELIREHHIYDVPAIVCWEINGGNPQFLGWISESVNEL